MTAPDPIILASRKSPLAVRQAEIVRDLLNASLTPAERNTGIRFEIETYQTSGDRQQTGSLADIGGKGLFTKEIENALLQGKADIAVHSMKDMPAVLPDGLELAAIPARQDPRDALVSMAGYDAIRDLPQGARIGTASVRRTAQLKHMRPDLDIFSLRGNINTRLACLDRKEADAILLAEAGLQRLEMSNVKRSVLEPEHFLPALAQGALGLQTRCGDVTAKGFAKRLSHRPTELCLETERAFLAELDASCRSPMAGLATLDGSTITLKAELLSPDGATRLGQMHQFEVCGEDTADLAACHETGASLARLLLDEAGPVMKAILGLE